MPGSNAGKGYDPNLTEIQPQLTPRQPIQMFVQRDRAYSGRVHDGARPCLCTSQLLEAQ